MTKSRFLQPAFLILHKLMIVFLCIYTNIPCEVYFLSKSIDNIPFKVYNIIKVKGTRPKQIENK